jgi:hypothetical protein
VKRCGTGQTPQTRFVFNLSDCQDVRQCPIENNRFYVSIFPMPPKWSKNWVLASVPMVSLELPSTTSWQSYPHWLVVLHLTCHFRILATSTSLFVHKYFDTTRLLKHDNLPLSIISWASFLTANFPVCIFQISPQSSCPFNHNALEYWLPWWSYLIKDDNYLWWR